MKAPRLAVFLLSIIVLSMVGIAPAQADVTDDAIRTIMSDSVYVDSSTQAATPNVVSTLKSRLTPDDNIIIVMVEAGSVDATILAESLNSATNNSKIIAVAVGTDVYARSALMSNDQANDLMQRSKSITVTTVETLTRFVREVHDWQAKQPKPVKETDSSGWPSWSYMLAIAVGIAIGASILLWISKKRKSSITTQSVVRYAPERVAKQLEMLRRKCASVNEPTLNEHVSQLCADSDKCFKWLKPSELEYGLTEDSLVRNLGRIGDLLDKYKEIEEERRYIKDASVRQQKIVDAVKSFGDFVFEAASKNSQTSISSMDVDIDILKFNNL
jgi:hypothetical protein